MQAILYNNVSMYNYVSIHMHSHTVAQSAFSVYIETWL